MGSFFSRQNARVEELDLSPNNAYRYPPKSGNYFASHFIMGAERFETTLPEAYLFGENIDLNFLGGKPTPFPYPAPQSNEPTRTLRSLINIRKESLRFVKVPDDTDLVEKSNENIRSGTVYNIEFIFDSDVRCGITIHYFCTEEITANGVFYTPRDATMSSETYHYKKGVNQQFSQVSHYFDPSRYTEDMINYRFDEDIIPVLIQCVAEEGEDTRQSHMVIAVAEKNADSTYTLKALKQKLFVDGLCYLLQEIYGIENKNVYQSLSKDVTDEDIEDSGSECVICMSDARDTLILPCRHLCLCYSCADSLRYQANNCPICRAPFRALLQIRAVRKSSTALPQVSNSTENQPSQDIPPGYEPVSLIEALNGPIQTSAPLVPTFPPPAPPFGNSPDMRQKQRQLERHISSSAASLRPTENICSEKEKSYSVEKLQGNVDNSPTPEVVVASLISPEKNSVKSESLSLTRGEAKRHRKGFRTSSAPEKIRLLANSVQIVNEVGNTKRKMDRDAEAAETRSLLENNATSEEAANANSFPKTARPCNRNSPVSLSTPHSLHLCEKGNKIQLESDASPVGEDSDYYTPEDPSTTILVDQGTDTSLDTPQTAEPNCTSDILVKNHPDNSLGVKHKYNRKRHIVADNSTPLATTNSTIHTSSDIILDPLKQDESDCENLSHLSPNRQSLVVHLDGSLPGTPASNVSNNSSGDSFSSTSSTRLLLQHQSYETLPE